MHLDGPHIWNGIAVEGATALMLKGNAFGTNWEGYYATSLMDAYARGWRSRPDDLSETVKYVMMLGDFMHREYHGRYYAKAQNLSRRLRETYDASLAEYDVLAMPTLPMLATKLPEPDCSREEYVDAALNMLANTCPFDATGHPAMTVPCGKADDSPIGLDADRQALRGRDRDPGRRRLREPRRLHGVDAYSPYRPAPPAPPLKGRLPSRAAPLFSPQSRPPPRGRGGTNLPNSARDSPGFSGIQWD